jgi:hypothetical protein
MLCAARDAGISILVEAAGCRRVRYAWESKY